MTDLEREAREAAKLYCEHPDAMGNEFVRYDYANGYIAAATARDQEIATLRARVAELEGVKSAVPDLTDTRELLSILAWKIKHGHGDTSIRHYETGIKESLDTIDRWLATVKP